MFSDGKAARRDSRRTRALRSPKHRAGMRRPHDAGPMTSPSDAEPPWPARDCQRRPRIGRFDDIGVGEGAIELAQDATASERAPSQAAAPRA
jgi:hypothetical protein